MPRKITKLEVSRLFVLFGQGLLFFGGAFAGAALGKEGGHASEWLIGFGFALLGLLLGYIGQSVRDGDDGNISPNRAAAAPDSAT